MIPKLKEVFPNTEFSFMYVSPSETKGFYYLNNDLNLEYIEKTSVEKHKKRADLRHAHIHSFLKTMNFYEFWQLLSRLKCNSVE